MKEFFNRDMESFIDHRVAWDRYFRLRRGGPVDVREELDTYKMILRTAGDICEAIEVAARDHWHEETTLVDGQVVVPPHIKQGYEQLRAAGLLCMTLSPKYEGNGLPLVLNCAFLEMLARADASLMTIVGLQAFLHVAQVAVEVAAAGAHGDLQGSMDLTEPQAGSDLGAILTKVTQKNDRYFIDGQKIFITNGGAEVQLVLARDAETFEQSKGSTAGLSLLLCPLTLPDGKRNAIRVSRLESKLGIHGSPTCVVEFDHAEAFLLGRRGAGFRAMLDLMNQARLGVAAQAIGIAEGAYRQARAYAEERVQFDGPIIQQPLVKSMLTQMVMHIQAARALLYPTCALIDTTEALRIHLASEAGKTDGKRVDLQHELEHLMQLVRFFTPLCKYYATEISNDVTRKAIQIHGGLGYMAESTAGHYHSDSIITTIYEGTSEIQASFALKEMSKGALFTAMEETRRQLATLSELYPDLVKLIVQGLDWLNQSLPALMGDPHYALLNAKRVCEMVIDVVVAAELLAQAKLSDQKHELAQAFVHRRMLLVEMNARHIASGDVSRIKRYDRILGLGEQE